MYRYLSRTLARLLLLSFLLACGACRFHLPATSPGGSEIDKTVWERYFGYVGDEPELPTAIAEIMDSDCPFWPGKKVKETHMLVMIPSHVEGNPLTLDYLGELIQSPRGGGYRTKYDLYAEGVRKAIGRKAPASSYWVLMTRDVLPGSIDASYAYQCQLVADHATRTGLNYELPGILEAAVVVLLHHVRSGERLYGVNPLTWTRCRDTDKNGTPLVVGGFSSEGLYVDDDGYDSCGSGVAALCKLDIGH